MKDNGEENCHKLTTTMIEERIAQLSWKWNYFLKIVMIRRSYINCMHIFGFSYKDLQNANMEVHKIESLLNAKLRQKSYWMNPNYIRMTKEDLNKL
jgi:hypothetical protein